MRRLQILGDGERDAATLPGIVRTILGSEFDSNAAPWQSVRLHSGEKKVHGFSLKGLGCKLLFTLRTARNGGLDAVVACVDADRDKGRERLKQLRTAREADRAGSPPLPTALGEARPHNEAWLLDDPVAVRTGLSLPRSHEIPSVSKSDYPKRTLEELFSGSPRANERPLDVWADIAKALDPSRCNSRSNTGLEAFVNEVRAELGPLFSASAPPRS